MQRIGSWLLDRIVSLVAPRRSAGTAAPPRDGHAYVTLLTSENYLDGVLALEASLRRCGCVYPLWVVLGERIGEACAARLAQAGIPTCPMPEFRVTLAPELVALNQSLGYSHWTQTYDRLAFFSMTRWRKIVSIDSDMMVVRNTDGLFDTPHLSSVAAGRSYPDNEDWLDFSGGLLIIEPQDGVADALAAVVPKLFAEAHARGEREPIGDRHIFNAYFNDWPKRPELHLPEGYNVFLDHLDHYIRTDVLPRGPDGKPELFIVHYAGGRKPWQYSTSRLLRECYYHLRKRKPRAALYLLAYGALIRLARARTAQGRG
ncbi:MAG: glycosyltransferase [Armatimonadota bacterium]|nr:glycosyltransferase [Armatimonadota bacterium]